jgi:hypothetical protein
MKEGKLIVFENMNLLYTREGDLITMYQIDDIMFPEDFLDRRMIAEFQADENHRIVGEQLIIKGEL